MADAGPRYALYFAPDPSSALWRFGSACLGYDAYAGAACDALPVEGFSPIDWAALTQEPRRYGFHATLKAPFHLAEGRAEEELVRACDAFARSERAFSLAGLRVSLLSRFIALTPAEPSAALQHLAAQAVEALEPFRAPLSDADVARRLRSPLSPSQEAHLRRWGYPYVFEAFRFHMTLTGPLETPMQAPLQMALAAQYRAQVGQGPVLMDAVALFRQERRDAPFKIIRRSPLCAPQPV